jgi:hypothetical protein
VLDTVTLPPALGNLVAWGGTMGVYWLSDAGDVGWEDRNAALANGSNPGCVDPWRAVVGTPGALSPAQTPLWRCETGAIYRSIDSGVTWLDVTPLDNPPNSWNDTTAPTVADVEFTQVAASMSAPGAFAVTARWQEPNSGTAKWRSWLLTTADYGQTWTWSTVFVAANVTTTFDFADGAKSWLGESGYLVGQAPSGVSPIPASSYWLASGAFSNNCSGGPGYWYSDESGYWAYPSAYHKKVFIRLPQNCSFTGASVSLLSKAGPEFTYAQIQASSDGGANWTALDTNQLYGPLYEPATCHETAFTFAAQTNVWPRVEISAIGDAAYGSPQLALYSITLTDLTTGPTELRIVYATENYVLAIADGELNLYDASFGLLAKIGDCTDAEYDAGTYSAALYSLLDDSAVLYVYGRFDCTNGDTTLTGAQHVITSTDGGSTWASVESGWGSDICGAFIAGTDPGTGRRLWGIRNIVSSGACQLYSDIDSLTAIGSVIASFFVEPEGFHILDGQTMVVGGRTADASAIAFESYDGGSNWSDITGTLPITGVNKVSYA